MCRSEGSFRCLSGGMFDPVGHGDRMLKVRLSRAGAKKRPFYHIIVTDSESSRDGRFIEQLGTYDPSKPPKDAQVNNARLAYWLGVGARPSETVAKVLRDKSKADAQAPSGG